jgi:hypothetical protein
MRGTYTATYKISGLTTARTLMYLTAAATHVVEIIEASVWNASNETNEQIECALQRVSALGTPTATVVTPAKDENGDQAAAATVKANVTASEPSYSANTEMGYAGASSLAGYLYEPPAAGRPLIPPSGTVGLRLLQAVTAFDAIVRIRFREIG